MDDFVIINDINPYVPPNLLPGTWSANVPYARHEVVLEEPANLDPLSVDNSPICSVATTMGDGTVHACNPVAPNCPMRRNVIPSYKIDNGLWSLDKEKKLRMTEETRYFIINRVLIFTLVALVLYGMYVLS